MRHRVRSFWPEAACYPDHPEDRLRR
jgi:hypothetical protein